MGFASSADAPGATTTQPTNQIAANPREDRCIAPPPSGNDVMNESRAGTGQAMFALQYDMETDITSMMTSINHHVLAAGGEVMQRITISLDDKLMQELNKMFGERGYQNAPRQS